MSSRRANDEVKISGHVEIIVNDDGREYTHVNDKNTILVLGRNAIVQTLTNTAGTNPGNFVNRMVFGTGGTVNGVPRYIDASRTGLFSLTALSKPCVSSIDLTGTIATFTSTVSKTDAVGLALSELGLVLQNGIFYSCKTMKDLNKTDAMSFVVNWSISIL